jgi:tetratricopeptide (TPR) repeat protein
VEPYLAAIEIYRESNRLSPMARYYKEIADLLEKDRAYAEAIEYYIKVLSLPFILSHSFIIG